MNHHSANFQEPTCPRQVFIYFRGAKTKPCEGRLGKHGSSGLIESIDDIKQVYGDGKMTRKCPLNYNLGAMSIGAGSRQPARAGSLGTTVSRTLFQQA